MAGYEGRVVDVDTGQMRKGRVLAQRTPAGMLIVGFGMRAERLGRFALGDESDDAEPFISVCRRIADTEDGALTKADATEDRLLRRIAIVETLGKAGYDPEQPRAPAGGPDGGEWVGDGDMDGGSFENAAVQTEDVQAKKERFVDKHLVDAQRAADELGVPVENILGLSALESGWGVDGRFAREGNNFLSIYYPAPFAIGVMQSLNPPKKNLAKFASYADCLRSFVARFGPLVRGKSDPGAFASALQDAGKYGIDTKTGAKVPTFVKRVAGTIRGLRAIVSRRKI